MFGIVCVCDGERVEEKEKKEEEEVEEVEGLGAALGGEGRHYECRNA